MQEKGRTWRLWCQESWRGIAKQHCTDIKELNFPYLNFVGKKGDTKTTTDCYNLLCIWMSHLASMLLKKWCRFLPHNQNLLLSPPSFFPIISMRWSRGFPIDWMVRKFWPCQVTASPKLFFYALGMGFDKGILSISSITPKRKFMETLGYFHYDPLVIYVHRMTFYLLTHWMNLFSNNAWK